MKFLFSISWLSIPSIREIQESTLVTVLCSIFGLGLIVSAQAAVAQQVSEPAAVVRSGNLPDANNDARYRIGPGDVLSILVRKAPELSVDAVRVDQRGMIRIPMIDVDVPAACKTESDLAIDIATLYLQYKKNPSVDVYIRDFQSRPVAVIGAVNSPGQFRLQRRVHLLELLTFAGGPAGRAGRVIDVIHTSEQNICETNAGGKATVPGELVAYTLEDTLKGKEQANPFVQAGDIISLPEADQVFIIGHVMQPQAVNLRDKPITISRAIAMSGGPSRDASTNRIHIIRQTADGAGKQEIMVDLNAVLKQKAVDVVLMANDIVEVRSSNGKTILGMLTGAIAPTLANVPIRMIP